MPSDCRFRPIKCSFSQSVSVSVPQDKILGSAIPSDVYLFENFLAADSSGCVFFHSTYQGRNGQRSTVIEAICDEDTWIYNIFASSPGSLNDINVMYQSPLYMDVITGKWPPRHCPFTVNGNTRTLLYYLVDGIYPRFAFFVAPYPNPQTREQRTFHCLQEALRKDVERLFGILTARFHIMLHPCRFWSVPRMVLTTQTVA